LKSEVVEPRDVGRINLFWLIREYYESPFFKGKGLHIPPLEDPAPAVHLD